MGFKDLKMICQGYWLNHQKYSSSHNSSRRKQEEVELLKRIEVEEELRRSQCESVLNIQLLAIITPPHSSSFWKCVEGTAYNEKIQFVQTIIQDIDSTRTSTIKFLCKSKRHWCAKEQTILGATLVDLVFIEKSE